MTILSSSMTNRFLRHLCLCLVVTSLAGCATSKSGGLTTGSIPKSSASVANMNASQLAAAASSIGATYEKDPKNKQAGIEYANVLRMTGRNDQALAVMQQVAIHNPTDREVLAAYGKAQAAAGQLEQALGTITRAQMPDRPDWRLKSAEGAILDQLGRSGEARERYREALDLQPNEPSVLSNLGMSYLLGKDLRTAETYMRSAMQQPGADSGVRQNYALAVGLQGRFEEAEKIARQELAPEQAEANVAYLRKILSQQNAWKTLSQEDKDKSTN